MNERLEFLLKPNKFEGRFPLIGTALYNNRTDKIIESNNSNHVRNLQEKYGKSLMGRDMLVGFGALAALKLGKIIYDWAMYGY